MIGSLEIDPFNPGRILYGTGAAIYGADDVTALDSGGTVHIAVRAAGLEETSIQDLISPPSGALLISSIGDIGGMKHDNLSVSPPNQMFTNPIYSSETGCDYAELNPSFIVRTGKRGYNTEDADDVRISYSTDGGSTWAPFVSEPQNFSDVLGSVAISANGGSVVLTPNNSGAAVYVTKDRGTSWTACSGIAVNVPVAADRVNPNKFYAYNGSEGKLYVSTDGGTSFTVKATGLATGAGKLKAVPGIEGDVRAPTGWGVLWHSLDSGTTATKITTLTEVYTVGFGKAADGQTYPAIYVAGICESVYGVYRSIDAGATWVRINDDAHQYGWIGKTITGDPRVYGRVYLGTNGRGILYGEPSGGTATPAPTEVPATPTPTTPPADTIAPTIEPTSPAGDTTAPTESPTTPPVDTASPTSPPATGCTCANLCSSQTALIVPLTYDGAGEYCWTSSSIGTYVNSWNADTVNVNGTICTNAYTSSSSISPINGIYYVYYKSSYSWSHIEIK